MGQIMGVGGARFLNSMRSLPELYENSEESGSMRILGLLKGTTFAEGPESLVTSVIVPVIVFIRSHYKTEFAV